MSFPSGDWASPDQSGATPSAAGPAAGPEPEEDSAVAQDLEALAGIDGDLAGVDAALRRLDDSSYGMCVACGRPIDAATLAANPIEDHCASCDPAQGRLTGL